MSTEPVEIPKDAKFVVKSYRLDSVKEWFCPNCGEHGDETTLDCLPDHQWEWDEKRPYAIAEYCCSVCCEPGIYVTFNDE